MLWHVSEFPSFLWMSDIPLYVCIVLCLSSYPSMGCFHILAIESRVAMNMSVQISVQVLLSLLWIYIQKWNC